MFSRIVCCVFIEVFWWIKFIEMIRYLLSFLFLLTLSTSSYSPKKAESQFIASFCNNVGCCADSESFIVFINCPRNKQCMKNGCNCTVCCYKTCLPDINYTNNSIASRSEILYRRNAKGHPSFYWPKPSGANSSQTSLSADNSSNIGRN